MQIKPSSWRKLATRLGFILEKRPKRGRMSDVPAYVQQYEERRLLTAFAVNDVTFSESGSASFTISIDAPLGMGQSASVQFATANNTATSGGGLHLHQRHGHVHGWARGQHHVRRFGCHHFRYDR